jgi:hypothetical protein
MTSRPPVLFVNYRHPHDAQDREVREQVNRHVMVDIGRARRKKPRRTVTVIPLEMREQPPSCLSSIAGSGFDIDNAGWELVQFSMTPLPAAQLMLG